MPTSSVALDINQYVRINIGFTSLVLQAHRDAVRIVLNDVQPAIDTNAHHIIGGGVNHLLSFPIVDTSVWALATTDKSTLVVTEALSPLSVAFGDSLNLDSFGGLRVSQGSLLFANKNLHSRNRNQWSEIIEGAIIEHGAVTGGPFQVAEEVRGTEPLGFIAIGTIIEVNAGSIVIDCDHNEFQDGDTITGGTSGATAIVTSADTGSHIKHLPNESAVQLQVGERPDDRAIRQSLFYTPYNPANGHRIVTTLVYGPAEVNRQRDVGYFDENDGVILRQKSTDGYYLVIRSSTSGSPVDFEVHQSEWNIDRLDSTLGKNPSGVQVNFETAQIQDIKFQWLGVGRVGPIALNIDGRPIPVHQFNHANSVDKVYMKRPSLPIRYEIKNIGAVSGTATLKEICSAVESEGAFIPQGLSYSSVSDVNGGNGKPLPNGARTLMFAFRLVNQFSSDVLENRITVRLIDIEVTNSGTKSILFELDHLHDVIDVDPAANWIRISGGSGVEYSRDITTITGRPAHTIDHKTVNAGIGSGVVSDQLNFNILDSHKFLYQNFDSTRSQVFAVYGTALGGASSGWVHETHLEFD